MDLFTLFQPGFILRNALWGSVAVGLFCPLIGVYFMLRRMVLMGVALPQFSAAGLAFVFLLQGLGIHAAGDADSSQHGLLAIGVSLAFTLTALFFLASLERKGGGLIQSRIGAVFALAYGAAILLVAANPKGEVELLSMLHGEIVSVSGADLRILLVSFGVLAALLLSFNRHFLLVSFDREFASSLGKSVLGWDSGLYAIIGAAITVSVLIVGPMLTFAAFVIPPLAARRFCDRMAPFFILSSLLGGVGGLAGFVVSYRFDLPLGPTDIVVFSGLLLGAVGIKKIALTVRKSRFRSSVEARAA
jgi:ABC-type Mn2+/Zn2+ transport system permease subunit